jgi:hypothetical protein
MKTVRRNDGWWIVDLPDSDPECGPYVTRKEADDDLRGLKRFYREWAKEHADADENRARVRARN